MVKELWIDFSHGEGVFFTLIYDRVKGFLVDLRHGEGFLRWFQTRWRVFWLISDMVKDDFLVDFRQSWWRVFLLISDTWRIFCLISDIENVIRFLDTVTFDFNHGKIFSVFNFSHVFFPLQNSEMVKGFVVVVVVV